MACTPGVQFITVARTRGADSTRSSPPVRPTRRVPVPPTDRWSRVMPEPPAGPVPRDSIGDVTSTGSAAGQDPADYGRVWASDYDRLFDGREDLAPVCRAVSSLAPGGDVLEFGVGTGRVAVPLAAAGLRVTGVDASPEMLELLVRRPGAQAVTPVLGDFVEVDLGESFDVVLIAFSTLFLVPDQDAQIAVLANAARHLRPGGHVLVEAFVPDHSRWVRGQNVSVAELGNDRAVFKLSTHDPVAQRITVQDVVLENGTVTLRPNRLRYAWPSELDAMARAAGLRFVRRTADWEGSPFSASSGAHVSTYATT